MRILVSMEIESDDYGGAEFMREIKTLLTDIDSSGRTRLTRFKMRQKFDDVTFTDGILRDVEWEEPDYRMHD